MGTRARVGIEREDGTVRSIYTHWDGYPSSHGPMLLEVYNTPEKINALLDLGDLSVLGPELGEKHSFNNHCANVEYKNWCCAYRRDRGEEGVEALESKDRAAFLEVSNDDYTYLFADGKWYFRNWDKPLHSLTAVAIKRDKENE